MLGTFEDTVCANAVLRLGGMAGPLLFKWCIQLYKCLCLGAYALGCTLAGAADLLCGAAGACHSLLLSPAGLLLLLSVCVALLQTTHL